MKSGTVVKGTVQISGINVIQYLVMGAFYIVVTKTGALTESDLGVVSVLTLLSQAMYVVASLSLPQALTKYVSENLQKGHVQRAASVQKTINRSVVLLFVIGYAIVVVLSTQISQFLWNTNAYAPLIVLMCIYAFFNSIMNLYNANLQALRLFGKVATVTLLWVVLSRVLGAVLSSLRFGVYGVITGYVIGYGIACLASFLFTRGILPNSEGYVPLKPVIKFSFPLFLGAAITLVLNWADIVFIASLTADYAAVGIYYVAVQSATLLSVLWIPITFTIFPLLSGRYGLQDFQGVSEVITTASRYIAYLMVPCCMALVVLAPTALRFFYVEEYVAGAASLVILSFAQIFVAIFFVLTTALMAIEKTTTVLKVNVISVVAYFGFLVFLVPLLQATGAAAARMTMHIVGLLAALYVLRGSLKVHFDSKALWKSVVSSVGMIPLLLLAQYLTRGLSVYFVMVISILVGGCSYVLFLYLLRALSHKDFELLRNAFPSLEKYIAFSERIMIR